MPIRGWCPRVLLRDVGAAGRCGALVLIAIACGAHPLAAQGDSGYVSLWDHPLHVNAVIGESFPLGVWRNTFQAGDEGALSLAWPVVPGSGVWLEGQFNGQSQLMTDQMLSAFDAVGGGASIYSLTLNLLVNGPEVYGRVTPYIVGGGGGYYRRVELDNYSGTDVCSPFIGFCGVYGTPANRSRTQNTLGWDLGGGLRVRLKPFWVIAEARYDAAATRYKTTSFVPIVVGISW